MDLFQELMNLADAETMPYIHIGTDEVRNDYERVSHDVIFEIMNLIRNNLFSPLLCMKCKLERLVIRIFS